MCIVVRYLNVPILQEFFDLSYHKIKVTTLLIKSNTITNILDSTAYIYGILAEYIPHGGVPGESGEHTLFDTSMGSAL